MTARGPRRRRPLGARQRQRARQPPPGHRGRRPGDPRGGVLGRRMASEHRAGQPALAGDQPPRPRHHRHGRDRALLPRRARRPAGRPPRQRSRSATTSSTFGPEQTVAFFEYRGWRSSRSPGPAGVPDPRKIQFDHLSFNLPDEKALEDLRDRLKSHGCEVTDVVDHGFVRSIYFTDPNGIALEASWWVVDATGRDADYGPTSAVLRPRPGAGGRRADAQRRAGHRRRDPARRRTTSSTRSEPGPVAGTL